MKRIAVDMGGTFTDLVYIDDETSQIIAGKVRSTPQDIGQAVIDVVKKIKIDMSGVQLFINGTTAGLNAIAQRKGSRVGLITTKGFIDVLEMGRGTRKKAYDPMWKKPEPLVPRYLRLGLSGRMSYEGEVIDPLDPDEVKAAAPWVVAPGARWRCLWRGLHLARSGGGLRGRRSTCPCARSRPRRR